jgi:hypothetical protein
MKVTSRNYAITYSVSLVFMMLSNHANAACSRDDITFYLDKGFSTDQISAMCSEPTTSVSDTSQSEVQNNKQYSASAVVDDNALFLNRAIKAQEIKLSSDTLRYTQKVCIEYGEEDLFGFSPKVCPDITYIISLAGLKVLDTGKKYGFYGTKEVRVKSSEIKREIIGELKDKKPEERELIIEVFEKGEETAIPIRDDFSLEQVEEVLQQLSQ